MASPSLPVALASPPSIYHGLWYSHGSFLPKGRVLTLSVFWFTFITLALGVLSAWSLSRLWRIACAVLFYSTYKERPSWEESQDNVLLVNSKTALEGCMASCGLFFGRRRSGRSMGRARNMLVVFASVSLVVIGVNLSVPALIALIPMTNTGLVAPGVCGLVPQTRTKTAGLNLELTAKWTQWANAALTVVDREETTINQPSTSPPLAPSLPNPSITFNNTCPQGVSVCSSEHPFTFTSNYTLLPQHFRLDTNIRFALHVFDTCYRPRDAIIPLETNSDNITALGLFYGTTTTGNQTDDWTEITFRERAYSTGYTLSQHSSILNATNIWTPNSTLLLGGDTSILFYYVGAVPMLGQSSDPIFATKSNGSKGFYDPSSLVVPIICDAKYVICADGGVDCSPRGGVMSLSNWLETKGDRWNELHRFFLVATGIPPMHRASLGPAAVAASQTALDGVFQYGNVSTEKELTRLVRAGIMELSSYAELSAMGYWDVGYGSWGLPNLLTDPQSLCWNIIAQSVTDVTIPVTPYAFLLAVSLLIVLISYAKFLRFRSLSPRVGNLTDIWALHSPGQLHREVTERLRGEFSAVDTTEAWPTPNIRKQCFGPFVVTRSNQKRFGAEAELGRDPAPIETSSAFLFSPPPYLSDYSPTPLILPDRDTVASPMGNSAEYARPPSQMSATVVTNVATDVESERLDVATWVDDVRNSYKDGHWSSEHSQLLPSNSPTDVIN